MKSNHKIEWLTKSLDMFYAYNLKINIHHLRGGRLYELMAIEVLKDDYNISINKKFIKKSNIISYVLSTSKSHIKEDICVIDPYLIALGKFNSNKKNVAIIHHIDEHLANKNLFTKLFHFNLKRNLKKINSIVVVSEVWKKKLNELGIQNVNVIYNSFNVIDYTFSETQKNLFKKKYKINNEKPIIYIGPNRPQKGIEEVLKVIDTNNFSLIATGKKPVNHKNVQTHFFSDKEFRLFLSCCDIVLCMSTMVEGWNRIAHEALLTKTPVIGSGLGGMKELLEKSDQIILKNINDLNQSISNCLVNKKKYEINGFNFVSKFDLNYFETSWKKLINDLN